MSFPLVISFLLVTKGVFSLKKEADKYFLHRANRSINKKGSGSEGQLSGQNCPQVVSAALMLGTKSGAIPGVRELVCCLAKPPLVCNVTLTPSVCVRQQASFLQSLGMLPHRLWDVMAGGALSQGRAPGERAILSSSRGKECPGSPDKLFP
ncbi:hypothetical protein KIL84_009755 [Mauremys mutica]|uniref:Uncharacterized protein n=1 Tax=Mauremys mutica TaxID=74926 RepID=A0A9D3XM57_9SAUR|nr:hypothetical protein KIL84_009755 [Mauremys mutica]